MKHGENTDGKEVLNRRKRREQRRREFRELTRISERLPGDTQPVEAECRAPLGMGGWPGRRPAFQGRRKAGEGRLGSMGDSILYEKQGLQWGQGESRLSPLF
jgi:hypothetical protein